MSNRSPAAAGEAPTRWDLPSALSSLEQTTNLDTLARTVDPAAEAAGRGRLGSWLRGEWAGHALHPALTDLPIGCWTSALILDVVGGQRSRPAARRLIGAGLLTVPITAATGLAEFDTLEADGPRRVAAVHGIGNVVAAASYLLFWRARRRSRHLRGVVWGLVGSSGRDDHRHPRRTPRFRARRRGRQPSMARRRRHPAAAELSSRAGACGQLGELLEHARNVFRWGHRTDRRTRCAAPRFGMSLPARRWLRRLERPRRARCLVGLTGPSPMLRLPRR